MKLTIKALDNWELDVLGIPYGSPSDKDADGEYFTSETNLHSDKFGLPPVIYAHGLKSEHPEYIGKVISHEDRSDGRWYRVILDNTKAAAKIIWEAAQKGMAFGSTGAVAHLVRKARDGRILEWPIGELTLVADGTAFRAKNKQAITVPVLKAMYEAAGLVLPSGLSVVDDQQTTDEGATARDGVTDGQQKANTENHNTQGSATMETDVQEKPAVGLSPEQVEAQIATALKAERERVEKEQEAERVRQEEIDAAVKAGVEAETEKMKAEVIASNRLKFNGDNAPNVAKFAEQWKFDNLTDGELGWMINVLQEGEHSGQSQHGASEASIKALARRVIEGKSPIDNEARFMLKARGITDALKSDEVQYSTLASYGDDFVPTFNSAQLWANIVEATQIASMLPAVTVPQGHESIKIPVEGANPTFYLVAQATAQTSNLGEPTATVKSSRKGTTSKTLTGGKVGCQTLYTGELEEDSIIPWVTYVRNGMVQEGSYVVDHVVIDGDTATGGTTNINDIGGTPNGDEAFLLLDGFRKSCLVTTTANSRSGGAFDENDFIKTVQMMGIAGKNALDKAQVFFLLDLNTYWKAFDIAAIKTRDVFGSPTIENGELTRIWGYSVYKSAHMHRSNQNATYGLKANADGKVDLDTYTNDTKGALLAIRKDQWLLGYKRRLRLETTRYAKSDTTEITGLMRLGLAQRDTEASAISYNLTL